MRGYITLGKRIVTIHETGKDDKTVVHVVYQHAFKQRYYIARFRKQYHQIFHDANGWHLTIKNNTQLRKKDKPMANGNPQYYQEYFDQQEALAFCEQLRLHYPGIECKPIDNTWSKTTENHQAGEYLYTSVAFYNHDWFVTSVRCEKEFNDLLTLSRILTNVEVFL